MRFIFKTDYNQDIKLAKHGGHVFWYSLLCLFLVTAPWVMEEYWLAQLTFVLIYAVVGLGLMLLALQLMGNVTEPLQQSEVMVAILSGLTDAPALALIFAAVLAFMASSSLAVVLFVALLASAGIVPARLVRKRSARPEPCRPWSKGSTTGRPRRTHCQKPHRTGKASSQSTQG